MSLLSDVIQRGTRAAQPAATAVATSTLYFVTDETVTEQSNGTSWVSYVGGPVFSFTAPVDGDFSWVNQGGASISTSGGKLALLVPVSASVNLRCRVKTSPATPYTITASMMCHAFATPGSQNFGIGFRQSSDGKLAVLALSANGGTLSLGSFKYTSATVFSATYVSSTLYTSSALMHLRIADDGVNRICSVSADKQNWITFHSVGRTDFLTADQVLFFGDDTSNTRTMAVTLLSWEQA